MKDERAEDSEHECSLVYEVRGSQDCEDAIFLVSQEASSFAASLSGGSSSLCLSSLSEAV